jgi:hypothetical protein
LQRDVLDKNPDFVLIAFGSNDFIRERRGESRVTLEVFIANLLYFIEQTRSAGAVPVLLTAPYMMELYAGVPGHYRDDGGAMAVLDKYNQAIREIADGLHVSLIDIRAACDEHAIDQFLADGVHPSALGNAAYAEEVVKIMRGVFVSDENARRVDQNPQPKIIRGAQTVPLVTLNADDWTAVQSDAIVMTPRDDGTLDISNTNGRWPEVYYALPNQGLCVPVAGTVLNYDFELANIGTGITLTFERGTPTAHVAGESLRLSDYFPNAEYIYTGDGSKGDLANNQVFTGSIALSDLAIPSEHVDEDGFVTITGIKFFVAGNANQPITIRSFSLSTDGTGRKDRQDYERGDTINIFWLLVGGGMAVFVLMIAFLVTAMKRRR